MNYCEYTNFARHSQSGNNVSSVTSTLGELLNDNLLKTVDLESYRILILSAPMPKQVRLETNYTLNCDAKLKQESMAMEVTSELLRCSSVPDTHRKDTYFSDLMLHCFRAYQSTGASASGLKHFLTSLLHSILAKEKFMRFSPDAMFDLWSVVAKNRGPMSVELSKQLEHRLSTLFTLADGQGSWAVYRRICSLSPTVFVNIWLNLQLETGGLNNENGCSLLQSVLQYDCSQFSCLLHLFASISSNGRLAKLWESGYLDSIAATFVQQSNQQNDARAIIADTSFAEVASMIGRRFLVLLGRKVSDFSMLDLSMVSVLALF